MPHIKAILVGRAPKHFDVPDNLTVSELKKQLELLFDTKKLSIVFKGASLTEEELLVSFKDGDTVLVTSMLVVDSKRHFTKEEDPDADITYVLEPTASPLKKSIYHFCAEKLRLPNLALYWIFSVRPVYYLLFVLWMVFSPVAARYDLGPLYILGTIFVLIVANLGVRRQGEMSGYSLFNENVQRLPGQLNADQIDQQIRHGRM